MDKNTKIKELFNAIYGGDFESVDPSYLKSKKLEIKSINDKCHSCKEDCISFNKRQDLPYYKSLENIKTMVIAESPASGDDVGKLGHVFGWEYFENNPKGIIKHYENYFFNVLNLKRDETYITDGVKCYSHKSNFSNAFENCKHYLLQEIEILKPKEILIISKQSSLIKYLKSIQEKQKFELTVIPHPSNQNISKILTVAEIFSKLGKINNDEKWIRIGNEINEEYKSLRDKLK